MNKETKTSLSGAFLSDVTEMRQRARQHIADDMADLLVTFDPMRPV